MMRHLVLPLCLLACPLPAGAADDAPPRCVYTEVATLPMRLVGHWLAPAVEGTINGTPATMMVDTGAHDTQLTMTGAIKRDMSLQMTRRQVEGTGGQSRVHVTRLQDFSIGPIRSSSDTTLDVIYSSLFAPDFDGIVGAPFLLQADLELDLRAKRLRFFKPEHCGATPLYLWKEGTVEVPFLPSDDESPNPLFTVTINGKEVEAIIDSGATMTTLAQRAARRIGIDLDGPDVKRAGSKGGVGSAPVPYWTAKLKSFAIAGETILDAELSIDASKSRATHDLVLGQDFLRTHRVLFAMSQKKLYIAYLDGQPFSPHLAMEPWMREEAENGNPDAQNALAARYASGTGIARDEAQARAWLDKAAANGNPHANLRIGADLVKAGKHAEAIAKLRKGLDRLPTDRHGALWLYLACVHNGEAVLAKTELRASLQKADYDIWPTPIARFYLGDISAARVLDSAAENKDLARERSCESRRYIARWYAAQGDGKPAEPLLSKAGADCDPSWPPPGAAKAPKAP